MCCVGRRKGKIKRDNETGIVNITLTVLSTVFDRIFEKARKTKEK